ncbi:MAG: GNAT family N-acetyltransferase [Gemmatimonadota bacterium]
MMLLTIFATFIKNLRHGVDMLKSRARKARDELALPPTANDVPLDNRDPGSGAMPLTVAPPITYSGMALRRKMSTAAGLIRGNPRELFRTLVGRSERYVAYVADPCKVPAAGSVQGWEVRKIGEEILIGLASSHPEFLAQRMRLNEGRLNDAFGLYVENVLAGVAWMIPSEHDAMYAVRNVKLRANEVELTHCVTLPEFRGRGVYTFMIRWLCALACQRQVRRVFMITNRTNVASQGGIQKAGLKQTGGIHRHVFDFINPRVAVTFRRHRWGPLGWR